MKKLILPIIAFVPLMANAQAVQNDATAPLHLMKPAYKYPYGVPKKDDVKASTDRILKYLDETTFCELDETGKQLKRGDFRLTSYEWGVTYSAMLRAGELFKDSRYTKYATDRMSFLAEQAPKFKKWLDKGEKIDPLMMQVVAPDALDDCGAICCAMMKCPPAPLIVRSATLSKKERGVTSGVFSKQIEVYYDFIKNKEYRYEDGQFARLRPVKNTVWLDDMFMGIPALALHGDWEEAMMQFRLFHDKMWVPSKQLYRHGWIPGIQENTPDGSLPLGGGAQRAERGCFFWGRANGWALLTACELLDIKEDPYIMQCFKEHLNGLCALQGFDGAWHQLLDRNDTYLETSCTAIYCYCLAHAINKGWIPAEPYVGQTLLAWNYVNAHITERGQVSGTCVGTGLAFDPAFYAYRPVNNYAAHGYGPTIWAGAEIYELISTHCIKTNDSAVHYYEVDPNTDEPIFYVK